MSRWSALALLLAFAGALALRSPHLDARPFHNDEAVNGIKLIDLWQKGDYAYDPDEYHGPVLHYASLPFLWLSGARHPEDLTDSLLRCVTVAFGVGLILLMPLFAGGLDRSALVWAAMFTAVSPAMVFYSRYFIHEMILVFFTALTLGAGWRYTQSRRPGWAMLAGAGVGLMFATKETFVLPLAAMAFAAAVSLLWDGRMAAVSDPPVSIGDRFKRLWAQVAPKRTHLALAVAAAAMVWALFFSSFLTHPEGLIASIRTYLPWLKRAGGASPHIQPWSFYFERLIWFHPAKGPVWSEGPILLLAVAGAWFSFRDGASRLQRFLVFYTGSLAAVYSAISYKTPWCLLGFHHGFILLAGIGAAGLVRLGSARRFRSATLLLLASQGLLLAWLSWRAAVTYPADRRNPYVYSQTVPDLLNMVRKIEGVARVSPQAYDTVLKVIVPEDDYWPLPWYLRRFNRVGWYAKTPEDPFAPVIAVDVKLEARLDDRSNKKWLMVGISELRPARFIELYVELELWKKYVATLPRNRD